ncbi:MBL fold metallo-hydrolase [Parasporobacterium paucivorans]|uniref:7,8-dihydropterin-6-yl-methyl-4-(Beta-D-ribofuranosyl)aminobenzene 5'-phosphate synthase n=1 Tax=Parasporobacterium paucivorans DSM 15970 TaxID=1122934 RepID=A0A1M6I4U2_9FIRM|nr:MBL fold metallo-hydrolase [Parasporobacterium paucivorans]SHJ29439.1 7,8-dihydropterin-6-yl-methyl-4-(beta-D-ribofuranosyl)aminobenzene 5'-phosphate synthase [Parasporobacterium paucivorans DSM 15970]
MEIEITTLIENNPDNRGELQYEHGLSLLIEVDGMKVLFDTGQSGRFMENAGVLRKDLEHLDYVIISHGHYDHNGGLKELIRKSHTIPNLIVGEGFFNPKYKKVQPDEYKFIGCPFDKEYLIQNKILLREVKEDVLQLSGNLYLFRHFRRATDFEKRNDRLLLRDGDSYIPDDFEDEIVLGIQTSKGFVVIAGCSHAGIVNILKDITEKTGLPIFGIIGGTHLVEADDTRIQKTIEALKEMEIRIVAASHCTGEKGLRYIRRELKEQFLFNNTGSVIRISDDQ